MCGPDSWHRPTSNRFATRGAECFICGSDFCGISLGSEIAAILQRHLSVLVGARRDSFRIFTLYDEFDISHDFYARFEYHLALDREAVAMRQRWHAAGNKRFKLIN